MRLQTSALALLTLLLSAAPARATPLPLKRVRLYETGVAYFERGGKVEAGLSLPVPAGHLDDALKTLVVLSEDADASVSGIEFASSVSHDMARVLAGLPQEGVDYSKLLDSMKGAHVELRAASGSYKGRLVEVIAPAEAGERECEERDKKEVCTTSRFTTLLLVTDNDEVRRFRSTEVESIRPTSKAWRARIDSALDALTQRGQQSRLRVLADRGKPISLGYIAEAPVWRSSYRLVIDGSGKKADRLQGWALLHNDTDEDWKRVKVELVNGEPDSFLFPLAAPRYARRQLITPERDLSTIPQLIDQTVDNMWSPAARGTMWGDAIGESFGAGGLGLSGVGEGGGGRGEGIGLGTVGESALLAVGNLANLANAEGVESGALFRYALPDAVDLRAHGSALMPFFDDGVKVEPITYFEKPGNGGRAAVHLKNDTPQTFPAGPVAIFADGGFAGETALSRTKPGEERILRFGFDLDLDLEEVQHLQVDEPRVLRVQGEQLVRHFVRHHAHTYNLSNKSGRGRKVYLALAYVRNADVKGVDALTYDEEKKQPLAVFTSPARSKQRHEVKVREGLSDGQKLANLKAATLRSLAAQASLPKEQRAILQRTSRHLEASERHARGAAAARSQSNDVEYDMARLRKNLAAARGESALLDRLLAAETKLSALRRRIADLDQGAKSERKRGLALLRRLNEVKP